MSLSEGLTCNKDPEYYCGRCGVLIRLKSVGRPSLLQSTVYRSPALTSFCIEGVFSVLICQAATEDVKEVLAQLSKLRYELQTDKPMEPITTGEDVGEWDMVFDRYRQKLKGEDTTWFSVSWLFAECFMYRKIVEILQGRLG